MEHWITKAIIYKLLINAGKKVDSEVKIEDGKFKIDIINLSDRELIEIETNIDSKLEYDKLKCTLDWNDIFIIEAIKFPITKEKILNIKTKLGL